MFPQAMVNWNWMKWSFKPLGNGFSAIYSIVTWNGRISSLAVYSGTKGQQCLWLTPLTKNKHKTIFIYFCRTIAKNKRILKKK